MRLRALLSANMQEQMDPAPRATTMRTHISYWLRAFRPPLQRAYPCTEEALRELEELLRQAERRTARGEHSADDTDPQTRL
jgi:hypothetical protein